MNENSPNNKHLYKVYQPLPFGRFLEVGESIKEGDLFLPGSRGFEPAQDHMFGKEADKTPSGYRWYRPAQQVNLAGDGFRNLDLNEKCQLGDEWTADGGATWSPILECSYRCIPGTWWNFRYQPEIYFVRRPVKAEAERVDPGAGYRLLNIGEKVQEGDEFYDSTKGEWKKSEHEVSFFLLTYDTYRRKIEQSKKVPEKAKTENVQVPQSEVPDAAKYVFPCLGYRLLNIGETIETGDQFLRFDKIWGDTCFAGIKVSKGSDAYRRKIVETKKEELKPIPAKLGKSKKEEFKPIPAKLGKPKKEYRILGPDEIIQNGDKYYTDQRGWKNVNSSIGYRAGEWYRHTFNPHPGKRFRRLVKVEGKPNPDCSTGWLWVKTDETVLEGDQYHYQAYGKGSSDVGWVKVNTTTKPMD